jgi:integrase/recombinase XerD
MGEIRERFLQYMRLKGYSGRTLESYEYALEDLSRAYKAAPDTLNNAQIQAHVDHLIVERKLAWNTVNVYVSAFRCFYGEVLKRPAAEFSLPPRGRSKKRPNVLDRESVRKILDAPRCLKHRALLTLTYGSGLRVSEVIHLKPCHIESAPDRMMVRVEQGKGRKDRYTILSRHSLELLRTYWKEYRPTEWLFFGFDRSKPMTDCTAQRSYYQACEAAGLVNCHGIHSLRHAFATHLLEQGTDLLVIKRCLGHSSLSTTAQYCHISAAHLQKVRSPADVLYETAP